MHVAKGLGVVLWLFFFPTMLGFLICFAVGWMIDLLYEQAYLPRLREGSWRQLFSYHTVCLHAKMAKQDSVVTPEEISAFKEVCVFPESEKDVVAHLYNEARATSSGFEEHALQLRELCADDPILLEYVLETLLYVYYRASCAPPCYDFIRASANLMRLSDAQLQEIDRAVSVLVRSSTYSSFKSSHEKASAKGQSSKGATQATEGDISKAFATLSLKEGASEAEVKKAYRRLIKEGHPDKLRGAGVSDAKIQKAESQMMAWNAAYDLIMDSYKS